MRSKFVKQRRGILSLVLALVVIAIGFYFTINNPDDEIYVSTPTATPLSDITPTPTIVSNAESSPISPASPLSPVSPVEGTSLPQIDPETLAQMVQDGIQFYESGDYEKAIELLDEVLAQNPVAIVAYNARGSAHMALGNNEKAFNDFAKALEIESNFPHVYYNRGRLRASLGMYDEALADLQKAIELAPQEFGYRANGNIGLIYYQLGEYSKALEAFEASISYNVDEKADIYYLRGETYLALENYEAAITDYEAAIERFARYDLAYQSLGYTYYKSEQFDNALDNLNQALEISPDSPIAHLYIALAYLVTDRPDEAISAASQGVNLMNTLSEEEQEAILARILTDLEAVTQEQPEKSETIETIIDLIPAQ